MSLIADNLTIRRAGRTIIDALSFRVERGNALLLTGPNGAGKTTLLRALAGSIRLESGRLRLEGGDAEASVGEQAHYIGHQNAIKPALTAAENLAFWAIYLGSMQATASAATVTRAATVAGALARLGLADLADVPAGLLSAGQRRRLALARLLAANRPVWLLDEPTVSLDAASVIAFAQVIKDYLGQDGIVIAATHVPLGLDGARELTLGRRRADHP